MTPEDIAQITAIVAAAEQRITARQEDAMEALTAIVAVSEQRITARQEGAMEALTANLSEVRQELIARLDTLDRRTERTEINVNSILMQLAGISRSLTVGEQLDSRFATTQGAQQSAIEQLAQRLTKLERELHPEQY